MVYRSSCSEYANYAAEPHNEAPMTNEGSCGLLSHWMLFADGSISTDPQSNLDGFLTWYVCVASWFQSRILIYAVIGALGHSNLNVPCIKSGCEEAISDVTLGVYNAVGPSYAFSALCATDYRILVVQNAAGNQAIIDGAA
jgi:hypothetical protein